MIESLSNLSHRFDAENNLEWYEVRFMIQREKSAGNQKLSAINVKWWMNCWWVYVMMHKFHVWLIFIT